MPLACFDGWQPDPMRLVAVKCESQRRVDELAEKTGPLRLFPHACTAWPKCPQEFDVATPRGQASGGGRVRG